MFNDRRVVDFLTRYEQSGADRGLHASELWYTRDCLDKYGRLGVVSGDPARERIERLLGQERAALEAIRSSSPERSTPSEAVQSVVDAAKSLKEMKEPEGIRLINEHFSASDGGPHDAALYDAVLANFVSYADLTPAALEGLKRIRTGEIYRGCQFFDMTYERLLGSRYDAKYADAMLIALERAVNPSETMRRSGLAAVAVDTCTRAIESQLRNPAVREAFVRDIYPGLSQAQRDIARRFLR